MTDPNTFVPSYNQPLTQPPQPSQNQEKSISQPANQPHINQNGSADNSFNKKNGYYQNQDQTGFYSQQNEQELPASEVETHRSTSNFQPEPSTVNQQPPSKKFVKQFGDPPPEKKKKLSPFIIILAAVIFLLFGVLAFFIYEQNLLRSTGDVNETVSPIPNNVENNLNHSDLIDDSEDHLQSNPEAEGPAITSPTATPSALLDNSIEPEPDSPAIYELTEQFEDEEFDYSISYGEEWIFRKTYGADVVKVVETNVLSGFDLHLYEETDGDDQVILGNVGVNLLSAEGKVDVDDWIQEHELNEPRSEKRKIQFNQVLANYYTYPDEPDKQARALFFIKGDYMYKIWWWGASDEALDEAMAIVETFAAAE